MEIHDWSKYFDSGDCLMTHDDNLVSLAACTEFRSLLLDGLRRYLCTNLAPNITDLPIQAEHQAIVVLRTIGDLCRIDECRILLQDQQLMCVILDVLNSRTHQTDRRPSALDLQLLRSVGNLAAVPADDDSDSSQSEAIGAVSYDWRLACVDAIVKSAHFAKKPLHDPQFDYAYIRSLIGSLRNLTIVFNSDHFKAQSTNANIVSSLVELLLDSQQAVTRFIASHSAQADLTLHTLVDPCLSMFNEPYLLEAIVGNDFYICRLFDSILQMVRWHSRVDSKIQLANNVEHSDGGSYFHTLEEGLDLLTIISNDIECRRVVSGFSVMFCCHLNGLVVIVSVADGSSQLTSNASIVHSILDLLVSLLGNVELVLSMALHQSVDAEEALSNLHKAALSWLSSKKHYLQGSAALMLGNLSRQMQFVDWLRADADVIDADGTRRVGRLAELYDHIYMVLSDWNVFALSDDDLVNPTVSRAAVAFFALIHTFFLHPLPVLLLPLTVVQLCICQFTTSILRPSLFPVYQRFFSLLSLATCHPDNLKPVEHMVNASVCHKPFLEQCVQLANMLPQCVIPYLVKLCSRCVKNYSEEKADIPLMLVELAQSGVVAVVLKQLEQLRYSVSLRGRNEALDESLNSEVMLISDTEHTSSLALGQLVSAALHQLHCCSLQPHVVNGLLQLLKCLAHNLTDTASAASAASAQLLLCDDPHRCAGAGTFSEGDRVKYCARVCDVARCYADLMRQIAASSAVNLSNIETSLHQMDAICQQTSAATDDARQCLDHLLQLLAEVSSACNCLNQRCGHHTE